MQSSTDPVLVSEFHPCEKNIIVTCGKGQISFWTLEGSTLTRKQGIFEVKFSHKPNVGSQVLKISCTNIAYIVASAF